jgi:single-strand DNA-binding protein
MTALLTIHRSRVHASRAHLLRSYHVVMRRFGGAPDNKRYPAFNLEPKEDCHAYQSPYRLYLTSSTMKSLNKVTVSGHLATHPVRTQTKTGEECVAFTVAIYREASDADESETIDYHRVIVLGKLGDICAKYLSKGQSVCIAGALVNGTYEMADELRYDTKIYAEEVNLLTWTKRSGVAFRSYEPLSRRLPRDTAGTQTPQQGIHSSDGKDM